MPRWEAGHLGAARRIVLMGVFESACKMVPMELDMRFMDDEDEDDSDDEDNYCNTAPNVY